MIEALDIDRYVLSAFNGQLPEYGWFFYIVTQAGGPLALMLIASAAFLLGKNKVKICALVLMVGLFFSIILVDDVKDLVRRPRPEAAYSTFSLFKNDFSFPSGHALAVLLAASVVGAYFGWKYFVAGFVVALAVSLSRLYLGVHYPSDVLAGAVLGVLLGGLLVYAAYRLGLYGKAGPPSAFDRQTLLSPAVFLAVTSSIVLYYLNFALPAIFILAAAFLFIVLYVRRSGIKISKTPVRAFILIALGLVSTLSLYSVGLYAISLSAIAITYVAVISLPMIKEKAYEQRRHT